MKKLHLNSYFMIGKLYTARILLHKEHLLSTSEYNVIQYHAEQAHQLLCKMGYENIAHFAKSHHERIVGFAYPEGLVGK